MKIADTLNCTRRFITCSVIGWDKPERVVNLSVAEQQILECDLESLIREVDEVRVEAIYFGTSVW